MRNILLSKLSITLFHQNKGHVLFSEFICKFTNVYTERICKILTDHVFNLFFKNPFDVIQSKYLWYCWALAYLMGYEKTIQIIQGKAKF